MHLLVEFWQPTDGKRDLLSNIGHNFIDDDSRNSFSQVLAAAEHTKEENNAVLERLAVGYSIPSVMDD